VDNVSKFCAQALEHNGSLNLFLFSL
jgi:hypothetical protein